MRLGIHLFVDETIKQVLIHLGKSSNLMEVHRVALNTFYITYCKCDFKDIIYGSTNLYRSKCIEIKQNGPFIWRSKIFQSQFYYFLPKVGL